MKKILTLSFAMLFAPLAFAGTCETKVGNTFTANQQVALCRSFGSAINNSLVPSTTNAYDLGSSTLKWKDIHLTGDAILYTSGKTISIQEATASTACMGASTPNGTTAVTVTTSCAAVGSRVFLSRNGGTTANIGVPTITTSPNGTSFQFKSTNAADTDASSVIWWIVKEAA